MFKVGDKVKTRDGHDARILATDLKGSDSIAAAVVIGDCEYISMHGSNGKLCLSEKNHPLDLMPPVQVVYLNCYDGYVATYLDKARAIEGASHGLVARLRIEITPGRFDD